MPREIPSEEWERLEPLLDRILDADPVHRDQTLSEVSGGDAARRAELEAMLREGEREVPLFKRPAAERFAAILDDEPIRYPKSLAARYPLIRELAQGGMATVFLARDLKHEREVAVKIMLPELAAALGRPRFLREIGIAAGLRHPHIVPLFDSGESEGLLYYIMPYEKGPSLRQRLDEEGALPVDQVVSVLRDVCDALAYAHDQGIVHRDIKPDNILLAGRHAMVTDFGVARAASVALATDPDTISVLAGTPAYMPPEAVSLQSGSDPRADIYAVGVTAFELLAGERPGRADLRQLRPEVPPALAELVARCLARRPEDRYQSAALVLTALEAIAGPTRPKYRWYAAGVSMIAMAGLATLVVVWSSGTNRTAPDTGAPRLAVLPFQAGSVEDLEPLALGLTDNLIGALSEVSGLVVRSLNAVLPYRDSVTSPAVLARRLDVSWLVAGRLYRLGPEVVASVELTEARTGRLLSRSETRVEPGQDVQLIEEVVPAVAAMLRERLGEEIRVQGWRAGTRSDSAFAAVNRAQKEREDANRLAALRDIPGAWEGLGRADAALQMAAQADPRWVEPVIQRALNALHGAMMFYGSGVFADSVPTVLRQGIAHAEAALALAPAEARAREVLGVLLFTSAQFLPGDDSTAAKRARAEQLLEQAIEADPGRVDALTTLGSIYFSRAQFERAYVTAERAYRTDTYRSDPQEVLARLFTYSFEAEEDAEAARWCAEYGRRFPEDWFGGFCRLYLMVWDSTTLAHPDTARRIAELSTGLAPRVIRSAVRAELQTLVAGVLARAGSIAAARQALADARTAALAEPISAREPFASELLDITAGVRLRLGDADSAARLLQELLERHPDREARLRPSRRFRELSGSRPPAPQG